MKPRYQRMLNGMAAGGKIGPAEWSVYILECSNGSLYTGIAKDVSARFEAHTSGRGAAYTRINPPTRIVHQEHGFSRSAALIREAAIKRMAPERKRALAAKRRRRAKSLLSG